MTIKIITEKICLRKAQRVIAITGILSRDQLPKKYLDEEYSVYGKIIGKTFYLYKGQGELLLSSDMLYSEEDFQEILSFIRKAGDNLHRINKLVGKEIVNGKNSSL